jgi:gas vesicle protein GvpL/GvpF
MVMATYLYCIHAEPVGVPAGLLGIDGSSVRSLELPSLTAWVSDIREVPLTALVERVKAHDAVCAAALDGHETPLPIRFGQTFENDDAAKLALAARSSELSSRLRRVAGCVELRVVSRPVVELGIDPDGAEVATDEDGTEENRPGTAFLRRLAREGRADIARDVACEETRRVVRAAAKGYIVDHRPCEAARGVSYFAILVRRTDVDTVRGIAQIALSAQSSDTRLMGPFAPYSFAGDA